MADHPIGHGPKASKVGHVLAKGLGIKLDYRDPTGQRPKDVAVTRGESVFSSGSADTYVEREPTSMEYLEEWVPSGRAIGNYFYRLLPFLQWIHRWPFNGQWILGDVIAGITVGAVVVPQSMAYAKLAQLPVEFGLYSSFMGVLIYWIFATSKDITIGPVAVMSTIVGNIVIDLRTKLPNVPGHVIASDLAIICGGIVCGLGFLRLGWIVDFISLVSVCAFITGSSFYIAMGQIPTLLGIPNPPVNNRDASYKVVINTLKYIRLTKLDAALGLTSLLMLYLIKYAFVFLGKRYSRKAKLFYILSTLRTAFVILLYTLISWLGNRHVKNLHAFKKNKNGTLVVPLQDIGSKNARWKILGYVPRGFKDAGANPINSEIASHLASWIPVTTIVMVIEHISIAKSFGRINNYTIDPSQEFIAIGVTNLIAPFLGAYPATGSFSRTAIKSKAGVRTPLAGVITAIVVLLAIYALPAVFFYIPNSVLAAVIIHAVLDLITPANTVYQFWKISPLEVLIFLAGVFVTVFTSIENGIYVTLCVSAALLLVRIARAEGRFLGSATVHSVIGDHLIEAEKDNDTGKGGLNLKTEEKNASTTSAREVFLPIDHHDGSNPALQLQNPYPGIFIYRFSEGFSYPNCGHYLDNMVREIFRQTRRTDPESYAKPGDRPWNDPGPRRGQEVQIDWSKPTLKAVILDFSSVNNVDITSVQYLVDIRNQLDRYAAPNRVQWHFASINNRWTKRGLASAGFGFPTPEQEAGDFQRWKPIFSVAEIGGHDSAAAAAEARQNDRVRKSLGDIESRPAADSSSSDQEIEGHLAREITNSRAYKSGASNKVTVVQGLNRPFFHVDLTSALQSAISSVEHTDTAVKKGYGTDESQ